ncbi:MAG: hypothetical protein U5Q16_08780 [Gammaproteobacteria bacterium]|nr:hypothetical protein [Gammaproteobacteria bacterium]
MALELDPAAPLWLHTAAGALLYLHIGGGAVGMVSGAAALVFRKGSGAHRLAGRTFLGSMLIMAGIGAGVAPFLPERASVLGGLMAFYLVASAWLTVWRPPGTAGRAEAAALAASLGLVALTVTFSLMAVNDASGTLDGQPPQAFILFGIMAPLAALGDLRLVMQGGIRGARRIARHLWRMCMALFIAVTSYFLGQPDFLPPFMRGTAWVYVPSLATLAVMAYWLVRVRFVQRLHAPGYDDRRSQGQVTHAARDPR